MSSSLTLDHLPDDVLILLLSHLPPKAVYAMAQTCRRLHALASRDYIFRSLCIQYRSISYKPSDSSWREWYANKRELRRCCPHLSQCNDPSRWKERALHNHHIRSTLPSDGPLCETCISSSNQVDQGLPPLTDLFCQGPTDIWLCLHDACSSYACGRNYARHAINHHFLSHHPLVIRAVGPPEAWCYECSCWLGDPSRPVAEQQMIHRLRSSFDSVLLESGQPSEEEQRIRQRRRYERDRRLLFPERPIVLIEASWYNKWMSFLRGDLALPPGPVDNERLRTGEGQEGQGEEGKYVRPDLILGLDYHLLDADVWEEIVLRGYGGGPRIDLSHLSGRMYFSIIMEIRLYLLQLIEMDLDRARRNPTDDPLDDEQVEEKAFFAFNGDLAEVDVEEDEEDDFTAWDVDAFDDMDPSEEDFLMGEEDQEEEDDLSSPTAIDEVTIATPHDPPTL